MASNESAVEAVRDVMLVNSLALPARTRVVLNIGEADSVQAAFELSDRLHLPLLPLGAGSNVVLPRQLEAIVLYAANRGVRVLSTRGDVVHLRVGAAYDWHALVCWTLARGFFGLENLALIPGNVGAAPVQNIGAYGRELDEFVEAVHGYRLDNGRRETLTREECAFAYRNSVFKGELSDRFIITAVDLRLSLDPRLVTHYPALADRLASGRYADSPAGVCSAVIDLRRERLPDPQLNPNAGSFFKNPVIESSQAQRLRNDEPAMPVHAQADGQAKLSAAWLIDSCDLRGHRLGPATVSQRHALVIENLGGAGQADVLSLAAEVRDQVAERYGVRLEVEPRVYGTDGRIEAGW